MKCAEPAHPVAGRAQRSSCYRSLRGLGPLSINQKLSLHPVFLLYPLNRRQRGARTSRAAVDLAITRQLKDTGPISRFHARRSSQHRAKRGHVAALHWPGLGELLLWYSRTTTLHYAYRCWSLQREPFLPLSHNLIS